MKKQRAFIMAVTAETDYEEAISLQRCPCHFSCHLHSYASGIRCELTQSQLESRGYFIR